MAKTKNGQGKDAIALLKADHDKVGPCDRQARELLATIEQESKLHTKIEEDMFDPALRDAAKGPTRIGLKMPRARLAGLCPCGKK